MKELLTQFEKMTLALAKDGAVIKQEITPEQANLLHMVIGASGEVGELVDAIKKHVIYQKPLDVENVKEELGDLLFYMSNLMQSVGLSFEEVLQNVEERDYIDTHREDSPLVKADDAIEVDNSSLTKKEQFELAPLTAKDPAFYTKDIHIIDYVTTPAKLEKFTQMLVPSVRHVVCRIVGLFGRQYGTDEKNGVYGDRIRIDDHS